MIVSKEQLNRTEPHYIRCIKPNGFFMCYAFEFYSSMQMIRVRIILFLETYMNNWLILVSSRFALYSNFTVTKFLKAVSIRKQGFPFRLTHEQFAKRYSCIFGYDKLFKGDLFILLIFCMYVYIFIFILFLFI